jgi:hypothetical protein
VLRVVPHDVDFFLTCRAIVGRILVRHTVNDLVALVFGTSNTINETVGAISERFMARRAVITRKRHRGPSRTSKRTLIGLRLQSGLLARVDRWAASQKDDPSRPEAIRRLVELGLANIHRSVPRFKKAAKAAEMAGQEIDRLGDPLATHEEQQLRKRRLIKGPKEFRDPQRTRIEARLRAP